MHLIHVSTTCATKFIFKSDLKADAKARAEAEAKAKVILAQRRRILVGCIFDLSHAPDVKNTYQPHSYLAPDGGCSEGPGGGGGKSKGISGLMFGSYMYSTWVSAFIWVSLVTFLDEAAHTHTRVNSQAEAEAKARVCVAGCRLCWISTLGSSTHSPQCRQRSRRN